MCRISVFSSLVWLLMSSSAYAQEVAAPYDLGPSGVQIERLEERLPGAAGDLQTPRAVIKVAIDLIKAFEGWASRAYDDPAGYCTIGYGHLIAKAKCSEIQLGQFSGVLSKDDGTKLMLSDTVPARAAIERLVQSELSKEQFGALTSFVYNVGVTNFSRSTLLKTLNNQEFDVAGRELRKWTRANGKILKGLVVRRNCEASLFKGEKLTRTKNGLIDLDACGVSVGGATDSTETIDVITGATYN